MRRLFLKRPLVRSIAKLLVGGGFAAAFAGVCSPAGAAEGLLRGHLTWSGEVRLESDCLVPSGSTLVVRSGTRVVAAPADSTKTDPTFWHPDTELAVSGHLVVEGTPAAPVVFSGEGAWGGIVVAPGGEATLAGAVLREADEGLLCVGAACSLRGVRIEGGDTGLTLGPGARIDARDVTVVGAQVGVYDARGEESGELPGVSVETPTDATRLVLPRARTAVAADLWARASRPRVEYVGEYTVESDETWRGEVILAGRVTVVPGAVLTLAPGTRVSFRKLDTNGDGLGEGELLVLGGIRSLGEPEAPVVFTSAETDPAPGDWDKVSLIASEDPDNRFLWTVFRYGVQSLHAHFSRFAARECFFEDNLRAAQFQESEDARVESCVFRNNKQALRFRDSRVTARGNVILNNLFGVHAFRCEIDFSVNTLEGNALGGFLAKECRVRLTGNRLRANRDGVRVRDPGSSVFLRSNRFEEHAFDALTLSQTWGEVTGNLFEGAGLDLVGVQESPVTFRNNHFGAAGRDALHLEGAISVDARGNFWSPASPPLRIYDRADRYDLGIVKWKSELLIPPALDLPEKEW